MNRKLLILTGFLALCLLLCLFYSFVVTLKLISYKEQLEICVEKLYDQNIAVRDMVIELEACKDIEDVRDVLSRYKIVYEDF